MKKLMVLFACILITSSCSKTFDLERNRFQDQILLKVDNIQHSVVNPQTSDDYLLTNCENPKDYIGVYAGLSMAKVLTKYEKVKSDNYSIVDDFKKTINELHTSLLKSDTSNLIPEENIIENLILDICSKESLESFILKSKMIEKVIMDSDFFTSEQKDRILTYSSLLRHNVGVISSYLIDSKAEKPTWKECFVAKLRELQNCGNCTIEQIICALTWLECLGVKALDCLFDRTN